MKQLYESFKDARIHAVDDTNSYYNGPRDPRESRGLSVFNSGVEMVNFIYGEVEFFDFYKILMIIFEREYINLESKHTFLDLGCGAGNSDSFYYFSICIYYLFYLYCYLQFLKGACLAAAAAVHIPGESFLISRVIGIDLISAKMVECRSLFDHYLPMLSTSVNIPKEFNEPTKVELFESNFLSDDVSWVWNAADIIYACATCFADKQMKELLAKLSSVNQGTILILLDKEIICKNNRKETTNGIAAATDTTGYFCLCSVERISNGATEEYFVDAFEYLDRIYCKTSWGEAYAHVYRKIAV